jgi:hypothetical protein
MSKIVLLTSAKAGEQMREKDEKGERRERGERKKKDREREREKERERLFEIGWKSATKQHRTGMSFTVRQPVPNKNRQEKR